MRTPFNQIATLAKDPLSNLEVIMLQSENGNTSMQICGDYKNIVNIPLVQDLISKAILRLEADFY